MNRERLTKLAEFLENFKDLDHWDMTAWARVDTDAMEPYPGAAVPADCRTAACAAGWATTIPDFKKAGLHLVCGYGQDRTWATLRYRGLEDDKAAEVFFDLTEEQTMYLFFPSRYTEVRNDEITPLHVAERIRKLLADGTAPQSCENAPNGADLPSGGAG